MSDITNVIAKARRLTLRRVRLTVESGPDAGRSIELDHDVLRLGTSDRNDLVLTDDTISRSHAEVVRTAHGVLLRDLDSTNGTFVGPIRVREVYLGDEQRFRIGQIGRAHV